MFSSLGLFQSLLCPERDSCSRPQCLFSHRNPAELPPSVSLTIPIDEQNSQIVAPMSSAVPSTSSSSKIVPAKRSVNSSPLRAQSTRTATPSEPPKKLQKLGSTQRSQALPTAQTTSTGAPVLRIQPALSQVAIPVRQAMLKTLYDHFVVLYDDILPANPTVASEHALRQEEEVYSKSNKFTYRNAVIQSVAALKRRPVPTSLSHASVGTEGDLAARAAAQKSIAALHVTAELLEPYLMSMDVMRSFGYILEVPPGSGGSELTKVGQPVRCERCGEVFVVRNISPETGNRDCLYHWGRPYSRVVNGERVRTYNCCSKPVSEEGCVQGPHVFYESDPETLHQRHGFSFLASPSPSSSNSSDISPSKSTILDVVALDCEMIYTTGGMRIARVSVVDGSGARVFDELVRMDEGVEVLDFNTRFSGITPDMYNEGALLPLASIRKSLETFVGKDTILIGHALENDLKTLRVVHHRCVDTVTLYPHPRGAPYRRALRDLAREHLNTRIQEGGGSTGHSSLEDAVATLDLVRSYMINNSKGRPKNPSLPSSIQSPTPSTAQQVPTKPTPTRTSTNIFPHRASHMGVGGSRNTKPDSSKSRIGFPSNVIKNSGS